MGPTERKWPPKPQGGSSLSKSDVHTPSWEEVYDATVELGLPGSIWKLQEGVLISLIESHL